MVFCDRNTTVHKVRRALYMPLATLGTSHGLGCFGLKETRQFQSQKKNISGEEVFLPPANEVWGKVIFFTPVCHSVHRGGEYLTRYPPRPGTPPDQVHPLGPGTPPNQVHHPPGTRYIPLGPSTPPLGPGTPPGTRYTPQTRYTPLDQVHPPG